MQGINKGDIVSSGAPQASKDGSVSRNSTDATQLRRTKLGGISFQHTSTYVHAHNIISSISVITELCHCLLMFEQAVKRIYHLKWMIIKMKAHAMLKAIVLIILKACYPKSMGIHMGLIQRLKQLGTIIHT